VKLYGRPLIDMECTLLMNHAELEMLHRLCSYGMSVVHPIIGEAPEPEVKKKWEDFLRTVRENTSVVLNKFYDANQVFQGKKGVRE
jgi:hypothetical protein